MTGSISNFIKTFRPEYWLRKRFRLNNLSPQRNSQFLLFLFLFFKENIIIKLDFRIFFRIRNAMLKGTVSRDCWPFFCKIWPGPHINRWKWFCELFRLCEDTPKYLFYLIEPLQFVRSLQSFPKVLLTMPTWCPISRWLRWHCVPVFIDYADTVSG